MRNLLLTLAAALVFALAVEVHADETARSPMLTELGCDVYAGFVHSMVKLRVNNGLGLPGAKQLIEWNRKDSDLLGMYEFLISEVVRIWSVKNPDAGRMTLEARGECDAKHGDITEIFRRT